MSKYKCLFKPGVRPQPAEAVCGARSKEYTGNNPSPLNSTYNPFTISKIHNIKKQKKLLATMPDTRGTCRGYPFPYHEYYSILCTLAHNTRSKYTLLWTVRELQSNRTIIEQTHHIIHMQHRILPKVLVSLGNYLHCCKYNLSTEHATITIFSDPHKSYTIKFKKTPLLTQKAYYIYTKPFTSAKNSALLL